MHAIFMLYGKKEMVDLFIRDCTAQKLTMKYWKGDEVMDVYIDVQLRILPFGLYEVVFPKEHMDLVLTTLDFKKRQGAYNLDKEISILGMKFKPLDYARKFLNIQEVPDFKTDKQMLWWKEHVGILPVGVRYDKDEIVEEHGQFAGWSHEAI